MTRIIHITLSFASHAKSENICGMSSSISDTSSCLMMGLGTGEILFGRRKTAYTLRHVSGKHFYVAFCVVFYESCALDCTVPEGTRTKRYVYLDSRSLECFINGTSFSPPYFSLSPLVVQFVNESRFANCEFANLFFDFDELQF